MNGGIRSRSAMWTYPWDVLDVGLATAVADVTGRAGLGGISLAASYHAGHFFQPRSPARKIYFPEDGTIYFTPDPARWEGRVIRPKVASLVAQGGDVLAHLVRRREAGGPAVNAWTVCLHNARLGLLHPQATVENAFGDRSVFSLCPSNPDARSYVVTLVRDLSESYAPDAIELETPNFMGFAHGYHHDKDGVGLLPEDDFLLSLCFCPSCLERAHQAGVDGKAARATVRRWITEIAERALPQPRWPRFVADGPDAFRDHPEVHEYVLWRFEPVTSLVAEIRAAANPASRILFIDITGGWLFGCDLAAIARECDGVVFCVYDAPPTVVARDVAATAKALPPGASLVTGLRLFVPELSGPGDLAGRVEAAARAGATGLNFYNYGLVPAARLDWVRAALDGLRG